MSGGPLDRAVVVDLIPALARSTRTKRLARAMPVGVPRSVDEVYQDPQDISQGLLTEREHTTPGALRLPGNTLHFDDQFDAHWTAPLVLGEQDEVTRAWLGPPVIDAQPMPAST